MSESYRVLLIASDDADRGALERAITRTGVIAPDGLVVDGDADRALTRATAEPFDVIVIDHRLRGALELVTAVRSRGTHTPIVLIADTADEAVEVQAIAAGATDLLGRDDVSPLRLGRRLRFAVRVGRADQEAAQMLSRAQAAAAARDELLAIVSHDLRSPLNAIVLACDALDADLGDGERKRYVGAIRRAGQRAERLLRDLLDVSRVESGGLRLECRPVAAKSILEQTRADHEVQARDAGATLKLELAGDLGQVWADRDRVQQVLANLVGNALKHAPGAPITLEARGDGDGVLMVVADTGPGIQPDLLPHVFDRFWQGRAKRRGGAGLGLTIARGIVEAHGGTISVDSEVGRGTRFTVRLPRPAT